jgi:membrane protease YdiL (CAAX protease family)
MFELAFLGVAAIAGALLRLPVLGGRTPDLGSVLTGAVAALPPFGFFVWTLQYRVRALASHRQLLEKWVRPVFSGWSLGQIALISVAAGLSEEALFRGLIQGGLSKAIGLEAALLLASVLFGMAHLITWTYGILATVIGAYLGLLWIWTGNLFAPITTHALYDFLALVYLLRLYRPVEVESR